MTSTKLAEGQTYSFGNEWGRFILTWTPRAIVAGVAGYYSLGVAYDVGIMARIDYHAIKAFRHFFGYAGIGAFMPTFQWYSAWTVRVTCAFVAATTYDLSIRIANRTLQMFKQQKKESQNKPPAAINGQEPLKV